MIILFGRTFVFWTGMIVGLFFILSFLGCKCLNGKCPRVLAGVIKHHVLIMKMTFVLFLIHASLAILAGWGIYI